MPECTIDYQSGGNMSKKLESILCVIDPTTTSQPALQRALWLSTKTGAKLKLLICYYNEFLSGNIPGFARGVTLTTEEDDGGAAVKKQHAKLLAKGL